MDSTGIPGNCISDPTPRDQAITLLQPFFDPDEFPASGLQSVALDWLVLNDNGLIQSDSPDSDDQLMERLVLAILYEATGGSDEWSLTGNWLDGATPACDWFGISCDSSRIIDVTKGECNLDDICDTCFDVRKWIMLFRRLQIARFSYAVFLSIRSLINFNNDRV